MHGWQQCVEHAHTVEFVKRLSAEFIDHDLYLLLAAADCGFCSWTHPSTNAHPERSIVDLGLSVLCFHVPYP